MGSRWSWLRNEPPPEVDIDAVLGSPLIDPDIAGLVPPSPPGATPVSEPRDSPISGLLTTDLLVLAVWRRERHVYCYDASGRCVGLAPWNRSGAQGWHADVGLEFHDQSGYLFSVGTWSSQSTSLIGGLSAATVTVGPQLIGVFNERGPHTLIGADGNVLGSEVVIKKGRWSHTTVGLAQPDGERLATYVRRLSYGFTNSGRRFTLASIIAFTPLATPEIRSLTLSGEICHEVQSQKHAAWGD